MMQINEKKEKKLIGYLAGILVEADFDFILTTHGQYDNDFKQELIFRKDKLMARRIKLMTTCQGCMIRGCRTLRQCWRF